MVGKRFFPDAEIAASSDGQYGVSIVVARRTDSQQHRFVRPEFLILCASLVLNES